MVMESVDSVHVVDTVRNLSRKIEDLYHRLYTIEDSVAVCNAYIEDQKEER